MERWLRNMCLLPINRCTTLLFYEVLLPIWFFGILLHISGLIFFNESKYNNKKVTSSPELKRQFEKHWERVHVAFPIRLSIYDQYHNTTTIYEPWVSNIHLEANNTGPCLHLSSYYSRRCGWNRSVMFFAYKKHSGGSNTTQYQRHEFNSSNTSWTTIIIIILI